MRVKSESGFLGHVKCEKKNEIETLTCGMLVCTDMQLIEFRKLHVKNYRVLFAKMTNIRARTITGGGWGEVGHLCIYRKSEKVV